MPTNEQGTRGDNAESQQDHPGSSSGSEDSQVTVTMGRLIANPFYLIAYGFGSGLSPRAPGTAGSLLALFVFLPMLAFPILVQIGVIVIGLVAGIYITGRVADELNLKDPGGIVWDEFIGMWIVLLWLPSVWWLVPAFVLFRLFDIFKPWPVSLADRGLSGGLGIMLDDVIAGIYALICLQLAYLGYLQWLAAMSTS